VAYSYWLTFYEKL